MLPILLPGACCTVHLRARLNLAGAGARLQPLNWAVVLVAVYGRRERNRRLGPSDPATVRVDGPLLDRKD